MRAFGFSRARLSRMVVAENLWLLIIVLVVLGVMDNKSIQNLGDLLSPGLPLSGQPRLKFRTIVQIIPGHKIAPVQGYSLFLNLDVPQQAETIGDLHFLKSSQEMTLLKKPGC